MTFQYRIVINFLHFRMLNTLVGIISNWKQILSELIVENIVFHKGVHRIGITSHGML